MSKTRQICEIDNCSKPIKARRMCSMHNRRWERHGSPHVVRSPDSPDRCTFEDCTEPHHGLGFCKRHYNQAARFGQPRRVERVSRRDQQCEVEGCQQAARARGWCSRHYRAWRRHGDPTRGTVEPTARLPLAPLSEAIEARGGLDLCMEISHLDRRGRERVRRALRRATGAGQVTLDTADSVCIDLLGLHPCLVFGDAWWNAGLGLAA